MKFVCDRCQTKYSIADEKVRGKVLKVRCKTCQNVITVREPGARPSVGALAPVRPSQPRPSGAVPTLGLEEEHEELSERTQLAAMPAAMMAELAKPRRVTPPPPPPLAALGDGVEWFLALDGAQQGPFSQKALVDKVLALPKDADVHVWNENMDGWKPPKDVPPVAKEMAARAKSPAIPVKPPVPRHTPSPPVPPIGTGARRGTMPLSSGVAAPIPAHAPGLKLPLPVAAAGAAHAVPTPTAHPHLDDAAASLLTPPPVAAHAHLPHAAKSANGANGMHAQGAAAAKPMSGTDTDALSALNIGSAARPAAPPRIMDPVAATAWEGQASPQGRNRGTKFAVAFLLVIGIGVAVVVMSMTKKTGPVVAAPKPGYDTEAMGKLADTIAKEKLEAPTGTGTNTGTNTGPPPEPTRTGPGHHTPPGRGRTVVAHQTGSTTSGPTTTTTGGSTTAGATTTTTTTTSTAFHERTVTNYAPTPHRPPPNQGDISRVINNNKIGIKTCYQRALLRDSSLTHGKIIVGLSIGLSGRVKSVKVDGPIAFRTLEPCIKEMVQRWAFPPSDEEYGTEFSYVFQGNE